MCLEFWKKNLEKKIIEGSKTIPIVMLQLNVFKFFFRIFYSNFPSKFLI